MIENQLIT
jgi:hypothetical protein